MRSGARESTQPCAQSSVSAFWLGFMIFSFFFSPLKKNVKASAQSSVSAFWLGFMIEGLGFRVYGSGFRVKRLEFGDVSHFLFSDQKPNPKL